MSRLHRSIGIALLLVTLMGLMPSSASAEGLFDLDNTHKYFGFGTIALAGATAASNGDLEMHESLAYATAACALTTVVAGCMTHGERFDTSDGLFTNDNLHIMCGTVGAIMLTTAVVMAANSYDEDEGGDSVEGSHAGLAVAGGALMTIAVIDIKF